MPIRLTPLMKKKLTRRAQGMIERALRWFPEMQNAAITVGYTRKHLGSAVVSYRHGAIDRLIIRLKVRNLTYQTIGHELTHLVQGLAHGDRAGRGLVPSGPIPAGEKQCDIWTLARAALFCDDAPTYLKIPRVLRERWPDYAVAVRALCIAAIEKRLCHRHYIRWLEDELRKLPQAMRPRECKIEQLELPLGV